MEIIKKTQVKASFRIDDISIEKVGITEEREMVFEADHTVLCAVCNSAPTRTYVRAAFFGDHSKEGLALEPVCEDCYNSQATLRDLAW